MKNIENLKALICTAKYVTKYEPILNTNDLDIYAYEALSKFEIRRESITTEDIFRELHKNNQLFFYLEKRNKKLQVDNFTEDKKLFLNFDADIFVTSEQKLYWQNFLQPIKDNIVVEITENGSDDESSADTIHKFSKWLRENKIDTALDDYAQDGTMFSFKLMNESKYVKIDKSFLREINKNKNFFYYLEGFVKTMKLNGKKTIIEGVETLEDLQIAKDVNSDYVQGYLFKNQIIEK
ncbi:MAG: EAL domain-containing protein [Campylobacteraceae bacterium]|nr:EAL domain-containing protein [Campylobacteraceae bacterium]